MTLQGSTQLIALLKGGLLVACEIAWPFGDDNVMTLLARAQRLRDPPA